MIRNILIGWPVAKEDGPVGQLILATDLNHTSGPPCCKEDGPI